ncbi:hypothetical protein Pcinc_039407 [Petrolisthes cinctipes]|uniref:Uncharacterized protein n=1 Tax=Petrolisthes cinctipes TaxID=88211 RepID=A0AAE1EKL4_PETCI|nr:hypothetical protein Pcinc_039407 [Petrolisthes cinctipes]
MCYQITRLPPTTRDEWDKFCCRLYRYSAYINSTAIIYEGARGCLARHLEELQQQQLGEHNLDIREKIEH